MVNTSSCVSALPCWEVPVGADWGLFALLFVQAPSDGEREAPCGTAWFFDSICRSARCCRQLHTCSVSFFVTAQKLVEPSLRLSAVVQRKLLGSGSALGRVSPARGPREAPALCVLPSPGWAARRGLSLHPAEVAACCVKAGKGFL